jgi:hypothetical protein
MTIPIGPYRRFLLFNKWLTLDRQFGRTFQFLKPHLLSCSIKRSFINNQIRAYSAEYEVEKTLSLLSQSNPIQPQFSKTHSINQAPFCCF